MKLQKLYGITLGLLTFISTGCNDDMENFSNNIFMSSVSPENILVKSNIESDERTFQLEIAKPEESDINFTIKVDPALVSAYKDIYYTNDVEMLPEKHYSFSNMEGKIFAGSVISAPITVYFKEINQLNIDKVYILPVSIDNANIGILASAQTFYYVFYRDSLINKVANIKENNIYVEWKNPEAVNNLTMMTAEALIRPHSFDHNISTLMGIEGKFLFRFGDDGVPANHLQIAGTSSATNIHINRDVPLEEWLHIVITYDAEAKNLKAYYNGELVTNSPMNIGAINWGIPHSDESNGKPRCFWIGYSYNNERWLDADIAEVRIWNRVLSEEEINAKDHAYEVDPNSEGLVAYWKLNDGLVVIKDYSVNGINASPSSTLTWVDVALPAKED